MPVCARVASSRRAQVHRKRRVNPTTYGALPVARKASAPIRVF